MHLSVVVTVMVVRFFRFFPVIVVLKVTQTLASKGLVNVVDKS